MKQIFNRDSEEDTFKEFVTWEEGVVISGWILLLLHFGFMFFLGALLVYFIFPRFTISLIGIFSFMGLIVVFVYLKKEHTKTKIEESQPIFNDPPDDLRPIEIGYLYDYIANKNELVALLLYFVYTGYIEMQIIESKYGLDEGEYNLKLIQKDMSQLREYEKVFLNKAFEDSDTMSWRGILKKVGKTWYTKKGKNHVLHLVYFGIKQELQKRGYLYFYDGFENDSYEVAMKKMADTTIRKFTQRNDLNDIKLPDFIKNAPAYVTNEGQLMWIKVAGFKNYIRIAEKERISFHTNIEKTIIYVDEMVPYSVALGVNSNWQKELMGITRIELNEK